jgi:DegV family protein with EDD domain
MCYRLHVAVGIVTDSSADLPPGVAERLGITVVPLHIYFGEEMFRDGVDLGADEFYRRMTSAAGVFPRTSAPSSADFARAYAEMGARNDGIISIHLSRRLSGTHGAAAIGAVESGTSSRIELVDSTTASLALGLLVLEAAELARSGAAMDAILDVVACTIPRLRFFGALDTLDYLYKGGRIGRAAAFMGSVLHVKPIVGLLDGVAYPIERVRGRARALARVSEMLSECGQISRIAVGHTTDEDGMQALAECAGRIAPTVPLVRAQCGPTLGTYLGPRAFGAGLILADS